MTIAEQITKLKQDFDEVKQAGYDEGYDVGYSYGGAHGYSEGLAEGKTIGYNDGYAKGDADGYDRGHEQGVTDGTAAGFEQGVVEGKQAEHDAFWNEMQRGDRINYGYAFYYWTDAMYKPKWRFNKDEYAIVSSAQYMYANSTIVDLSDIYLRASTSGTYGYTFFNASKLKKVGVLLNSAATIQYSNTFNGCTSLESIEGMSTTPNTTFTNTFNSCLALKKVTFKGSIGRSISFAHSENLTTETVAHIFDCLVAPTTTNQTLTFNAATEITAEQKAAALALGWQIVQ